jgi:hypothetical protein
MAHDIRIPPATGLMAPTARLITTPRRARTVFRRQPMERMDRRLARRPAIPTPEHRRELLRLRRRTANRALGQPVSLQPVHGHLWRNASRVEPHSAVGAIVRFAGEQVRDHAALLHGQWNRGLRAGIAGRERLRHIERIWKYLRREELERRHVCRA